MNAFSWLEHFTIRMQSVMDCIFGLIIRNLINTMQISFPQFYEIEYLQHER